jgi:RyR domain
MVAGGGIPEVLARVSATSYNARMSYKPAPIDTSRVKLSGDILRLTEELARNAHELWAQERIAQGWRYGAERNDARKEHPSLVSYEELPEAEKIFDRNTAMGTLKAILALGYRIVKA